MLLSHRGAQCMLAWRQARCSCGQDAHTIGLGELSHAGLLDSQKNKLRLVVAGRKKHGQIRRATGREDEFHPLLPKPGGCFKIDCGGINFPQTHEPPTRAFACHMQAAPVVLEFRHITLSPFARELQLGTLASQPDHVRSKEMHNILAIERYAS